MLFKIEKELILKKLTQKLYQQIHVLNKISYLDIFCQKIIPGKLIYIVLKSNHKMRSEYYSGICINYSNQHMESVIHILNITLNMKILHILLNYSPILFLCTLFLKSRQLEHSTCKLQLIKLYYFKKLKVKYLRTSIILSTILKP